MNTELMNTIAAANDKAQYDACAKRLIGQKMNLLCKPDDFFTKRQRFREVKV